MEPASFDNLEVGDHVRHPTSGEGVVIAKGDTVDVRYDHIGRSGKPWTGKYDRRWFEIAQAKLVKLQR